MKIKKITGIIVILILTLIFISSFVLAAKTTNIETKEPIEIIRTESTELFKYEGNKRVLTIFGGTRYISEDRIMKPIETARSLKNSNINCIVNEDSDTIAECLDYNATSITIDITLKNSVKKDKMPVKLIGSVQEKDMTNATNGFSRILKTKEQKNIDFSGAGDKKTVTINGNFLNGDKIHIGETSTTVELKDTDTEILDDNSAKGSDPITVRNGATVHMGASSNSNFTLAVKFNVSIVPNGKIIDNAEYFLVCGTDTTGDSGETIRIVNTTNTTWTEETLTYNILPAYGTIQNTTDSNSIASGKTTYMNVTSAVKSAYSSSMPVSLFTYITGSNNAFCDNGASKEGNYENRHGLNITYSDVPLVLPSNVKLYVNNALVWNRSGSFSTTETITNLSQEINNYLGICAEDSEGYCTVPIKVHSDTAGSINLSNIELYFNITQYTWNTANLSELSTYKVRISATDGILNSNYDQSDNDFTISHIQLNDSNKLIFKNISGSNVAWFGDQGNILLKGTCTSGGTCTPPADSYIFKDVSNNPVAYIDLNGNLCIETGDCSGNSASCSPTNAFLIKNSTFHNMSYIDFTGDLCLKGTLTQNGNP